MCEVLANDLQRLGQEVGVQGELPQDLSLRLGPVGAPFGARSTISCFSCKSPGHNERESMLNGTSTAEANAQRVQERST